MCPTVPQRIAAVTDDRQKADTLQPLSYTGPKLATPTSFKPFCPDPHFFLANSVPWSVTSFLHGSVPGRPHCPGLISLNLHHGEQELVPWFLPFQRALETPLQPRVPERKNLRASHCRALPLMQSTERVTRVTVTSFHNNSHLLHGDV